MDHNSINKFITNHLDACMQDGCDSGKSMFEKLIHDYPLTDDDWLFLVYCASDRITARVPAEESPDASVIPLPTVS